MTTAPILSDAGIDELDAVMVTMANAVDPLFGEKFEHSLDLLFSSALPAGKAADQQIDRCVAVGH